jgi:hypothetical protein
MYIMATEPISTAYFINPKCVCVSVCVSPIGATQRLGKNITAETNTYANLCGQCRMKGKYAISSSQNFLFVVSLTTLSVTPAIWRRIADDDGFERTWYSEIVVQ